MPEMDGLTLLTKLPETNPVVKAVMVSAYGDMENIRLAMNRGAFDFVCKPVNFEDLELTINKTIQHVLHLRETMQAIKENNILKMYVDENVLNFMTHKEFENTLMANDTIDATIIFIDICGFTAISEKVAANTVVSLINKYFDLMVKEIITQNGHVDKFMGDAIMAVYRGKDHLDRAIETALAIKQKVQQEEEVQLDGYTYKLQISVGINSGEVISGNIGSVSLRRLDYTVIGDKVNLAQRLQSVAQPDQILISEMVYERAKESFSCQKVGLKELKNKAQPVLVYEVLA
jgi:class 3 adenylate cyclase